MKFEYLNLSPMRRRILDLFDARFQSHDVVKMMRSVYSDIPERIYNNDMTDEDFFNFGIFLMGVATALLAVDNDNVSKEYSRECRLLRQAIISIIKCIMVETDLD